MTSKRGSVMASSAGRTTVLPKELHLGVTAAESAATLARDLIGCLKKGTTVGEWWASIVPSIRSLQSESIPEEHADTVAHLVVEGQHLRDLRARHQKRASITGNNYYVYRVQRRGSRISAAC